MKFEWDPEKARTNLAKHGVTFELAQMAWDDPLHLIVPDRFEQDEQRWHAIGVVGPTTVLVVEAGGEERARIIGARKATSHERRRYEQEGA